MMFIQLSTVIVIVVVWCSSLTHRFDGSRTTTTSHCHNHQDYGGWLFVVSVTPITSPTTTTELRWSSSGGGLRAMIANIGYAHVFHKVGLFDSTLPDDTSQNTTTTNTTTNTNTTTTSSFYFSGISTNSGGTWFGVQFFYSPQFYNNVVTSNTTQTYQFILDWLQSYRDYLENVPLAPRNLFCRSLSLFRNEGLLDDISDLCDFLTYYGPSYPNLIRGMLLATSTHYNDPNLIFRLVNATNRVQPLQHTEYYIQNAIATNSKFTFPNTSTTTTTTTNSNNGLFSILLNDWVAYQPNYYNYIGPYINSTSIDPESSAVLYSVPLAVQYVIPNHGAPLYEYAIEPKHLPLQVYWSDTVTSPIGTSVQLDDWDDYPLYPPPSTSSIYVNTNTTQSKRRRRKIDQSQVLSPFFQGQTPSIVQMATASGSTFYPFASVPSILAQWYSVRSHGKRTFRQRLINRFLFNALGRMFTLRRDLALCSQWPDQLCGPTDTYFLDGGGGDGPSLAGNIAQYQKNSNHSLNATIKVIVTNHNYYEDMNMKFLSYFNTTFTKDIEPGDLVWPPTVYGNRSFLSLGGANFHPWRSMQIFADYMDDTILLSKFLPIPNVNLTTAIYTVTTIDNPAYGVTGGQRVQILLLQLNSNIPTNLFVPRSIDSNRVSYANMANDIMTSTVLIDRIQAFMAM